VVRIKPVSGDARSAAVRHLHRLLRRLGQGHGLGPTKCTRTACHFAEKAAAASTSAGRSTVPELRLRWLQEESPFRTNSSRTAWACFDQFRSWKNEDRLYPALGGGATRTSRCSHGSANSA